MTTSQVPPSASFISENIKSRPVTTINGIISQGIGIQKYVLEINNLCTRFIIILFFHLLHLPHCYFYPVVLCISVSGLKSFLEEAGNNNNNNNNNTTSYPASSTIGHNSTPFIGQKYTICSLYTGGSFFYLLKKIEELTPLKFPFISMSVASKHELGFYSVNSIVVTGEELMILAFEAFVSEFQVC